MDIDLSQSDMSRLTTMLDNVGAEFARGYGPDGLRTVEIGNVEFHFESEGELVEVVVRDAPQAPTK